MNRAGSVNGGRGPSFYARIKTAFRSQNAAPTQDKLKTPPPPTPAQAREIFVPTQAAPTPPPPTEESVRLPAPPPPPPAPTGQKQFGVQLLGGGHTAFQNGSTGTLTLFEDNSPASSPPDPKPLHNLHMIGHQTENISRLAEEAPMNMMRNLPRF